MPDSASLLTALNLDAIAQQLSCAGQVANAVAKNGIQRELDVDALDSNAHGDHTVTGSGRGSKRAAVALVQHTIDRVPRRPMDVFGCCDNGTGVVFPF